MLEQDVQRWQQRSQQLIQSPRRQDPEEYRKLLVERQQLNKNVDQLNKDLTEKKWVRLVNGWFTICWNYLLNWIIISCRLEISNLKGEIRKLDQLSESLKTDNATLTKKVETGEAEAKTKQTELDEKSKTIMQVCLIYVTLQKKFGSCFH